MSEQRDRAVQAYLEAGTVSGAARLLGCHRSTIRFHLDRAGIAKPVVAGKKAGEIREQKAPLPTAGVKRYILTCAQNNVKVHPEFWANLLALRDHYNAELLVSRITYNTNAYTAQPAKPGKGGATTRELWYDPAIQDYVNDSRMELAPGLVWCGETNILPSGARPLLGFETYTGRRSGIFPHTKIEMESIASGKHEATKFNYTTGTVTQMAYIQRKAGQKAEHRHAYGALIVEVDALGRWFVRQLNAERNGRFYDLGLCAHKGQVTNGHRLKSITWGDLHEEKLDPQVAEMAWGKDGILDTLRPEYQFMHDTLNFGTRNHHDRLNPHVLFQRFVEGRESVEAEVASAARFLSGDSYRDWCRTIVVDSNHDNALTRWLREADYRRDPVNAIYFLRLQLRMYEAIEARDTGFHLFEWAMYQAGCRQEVQFLREDESFIVAGIENGMHGHLGPDGTRGTPAALSRMGRRANTAHTHRAGIRDGLYTAGHSSLPDLGYNRGPSSWSQSHIFTYQNGKRAICTMWNGAWRAE